MNNLPDMILREKICKRILSVSAAIIITLSCLLTGCTMPAAAPEVNTMLLQNEAGDFQYANVLWGMDKKSVETALGITFDQGLVSSSSEAYSSQVYFASAAYTLMKLPASVICEFDRSGLCRIEFRITPADADVKTCWDTLTSALVAQYGSTDPVCLESDSATGQISLQSETYFWEHSDTMHTALSARKTSVNGKTPMIELILYVIPGEP